MVGKVNFAWSRKVVNKMNELCVPIIAKHESIQLPNDSGYPCATARVLVYKCGRKDLRSYSTIVCSVLKNGEFVRKWDGYSATTMKHINAFRKRYGLEPIHKEEWDAMKYM